MKVDHTIKLDSLRVKKTVIHLKSTLSVDIIIDEEHFHAENDYLSCYGSGKTEVEAIADFSDYLYSTWEHLSKSNEKQMTLDAIELRDQLAIYFK